MATKSAASPPIVPSLAGIFTLHRTVEIAVFAVVAAVGLLFWTGSNNINLIKTTVAHTLVFAAAALVLVQWRSGTAPPASADTKPAKAGGPKRAQEACKPLELVFPLKWLLAAFAVFLVISTAISPHRFASIEELVRFLSYLAVFVLVANWIRSLKDVLNLVWWLTIVATLAACYGLAQQVGIDFIQWRNLDRIIGPLGNPNFFSGFLILIMPVQVVDTLLAKGWGRTWRGAALLATASATLLTFSRAAWVGGTLGLGVSIMGLLLFHRRDLLRPNLHWLLPVAAVGLCLAAWFTLPSATSGAQRVQISQVTGSTFRVRVVAWGAGWRMFEDAPVMGQGLGTYQLFFPAFKGPEAYRTRIGDNTLHAHSEWLEALGEMGLLGGGLYIAIFATFGLVSLIASGRLRREGKLRDHALLWGLCGGVIAGLAHGSLEVTLRWTAPAMTMWLLMGAAAGLWRGLPDSLSVGERARSAWHRPIAKTAWIAAGVVGGIVLLGEVRVLTGDYHLKQGQRLRDAGLAAESVYHYDAALRANPWNLEALYQLASVHANAGRSDQALETYLRLQNLAPDYASIDTNLALVHQDLGQMDEAIATIRRAVTKDRLPRNRLVLADMLARTDEREEALGILRELEETDPEERDIYFFGAGMMQDMDMPAEELALLEQGLERFPDDLELRRAAVGTCEVLEDEERLVTHLEGLLSRDPLDRMALMRLGDILETNHRWAEAESLYERHREYFGNEMELMFRLAQAAHRCGDWDVARPILTRFASDDENGAYSFASQRYLMEMRAMSLATTVPVEPGLPDGFGPTVPESPIPEFPGPALPEMPQIPQPIVPPVPTPPVPGGPVGSQMP